MRVALGFPDILIRPATAFTAVRRLQEASGADIVLGLFPTRHPERADMVELDSAGRPSRLWIKRPDRGLAYTWSIAVWTPRFTEFLHQFVEQPAAEPRPDRELQIGDVVQAALEDGMSTEAVAFATGDSLDVGEPEALAAARRMLQHA
jgi:glucose-1-phosphate thymidylyltransferase